MICNDYHTLRLPTYYVVLKILICVKITNKYVN